MAEEQASTSTFGHLIDAILLENNGKLLAKYKQTASKHQRTLLDKVEDKKAQKRKATERRAMMNECHVIPTIVHHARNEKIMRKIATFGVVALFKAVAKHQRDLKRSLGDIDAEEDVLENKTMLIEHRSTKRLLSTLNESSSASRMSGAMIETRNPYNSQQNYKKRKLDNQAGDAALPKHLQGILLDKNSSNQKHKQEDDDSNIGDTSNTNRAKQWSVLDEDMILRDAHNAHPELEDMEDIEDDVAEGVALDSDSD